MHTKSYYFAVTHYILSRIKILYTTWLWAGTGRKIFLNFTVNSVEIMRREHLKPCEIGWPRQQVLF